MYRSISASLIVINEINNLPLLIEDLSQFCDEIVIVDTGSTDGTREFLESKSQEMSMLKVYDFKWCMDFSKARNFSLEYCTKNWVFWCDADDRIEQKLIDSIINFKTDSNLDYELSRVMIDYQFNDQTSVPRIRLANREFNPYWQYPIHESLIVDRGVFVNWVDDTDKGKIIHHHKDVPMTDRNLKIFENSLAMGMEFDLRMWVYYAHELHYWNRDKEAYNIYNWIFDRLWLGDQYYTLLMIYDAVQQKKLDPRNYTTQYEKVWDKHRGDIDYYAGKCYEAIGDQDKMLKAYLNGYHLMVNDQVIGPTSFAYRKEVATIDLRLDLLVYYYKNNDKEMVKKLHEELSWIAKGHPSYEHNDKFLKSIGWIQS